jgi:hypothetical protein
MLAPGLRTEEHMRARTRMIGTVMAFVAAAAAAAEPTAEQTAERRLAAGKAAEVCLPLRAGSTLHWRFSADAALDFNLHHHVGTEVLMPVQRRGVRADAGQQAIDRDNDWCLMWTSPKTRGATVRVTWRVD